MKTLREIGDQHTRLYRRIMGRGYVRARAADPRTGGNVTLVHNWGNEAARAAWREASERTKALRDIYRHVFDCAVAATLGGAR